LTFFLLFFPCLRTFPSVLLSPFPLLPSIKSNRVNNSEAPSSTRPNRDERSSNKLSYYLNSKFRISRSSNDPILDPRPTSSSRVSSSTIAWNLNSRMLFVAHRKKVCW
jgi:hypothetical protein